MPKTSTESESRSHSYSQSTAASEDDEQTSATQAGPPDDKFDIFAWYPAYQSCQRYFIEHAQHEHSVKAVAALLNILLPLQTSVQAVSLVPYLRRLVVTGFDKPAVLHGFFGNDWSAGIGRQLDCERRNYVLVSRTSPWASVKSHYDMSPHQTVPFLASPPLVSVDEPFIEVLSSTTAENLSETSLQRLSLS